MGAAPTPPDPFTDDHALLRDYVERRSEEAFRALVTRHGGMVYGVARRLVGAEHAAAEITQSVFLALAQKADSLGRSVPLAGWLHTATRYAASHWLRSESRRRHHEAAAAAEQAQSVSAETERTWEEIAPWLDAALASLSAPDREAVLQRFFAQRSFSAVAAGLGTTEDAAKMRVGRAVKKLRAFLERRGAVVTVVTLTRCLAGHAAHTAPNEVAHAAVQAAAHGAAQGAGVVALTHAIAEALRWLRLKRILLTGALSAAAIAGLALGAWTLQRPGKATTWVLNSRGGAEDLLRDSRVILGGWQATPDGLAIEGSPWGHLAIPAPFADNYRLEVAYTQNNPTGAVEVFLPAGPQMMLVVLRPNEVSADRFPVPTTDVTPRGKISREHRAEIEVRTRGDEIQLSVKLDGKQTVAADTMRAALQRATMVPDHPAGFFGLGAMRTGAVFQRVRAQPLATNPAGAARE